MEQNGGVTGVLPAVSGVLQPRYRGDLTVVWARETRVFWSSSRKLVRAHSNCSMEFKYHN